MQLYHKDTLEDQLKDKVLPKLYLKSFQATLCLSWYYYGICCNTNRISIANMYALKKWSPQFRIIYKVK